MALGALELTLAGAAWAETIAGSVFEPGFLARLEAPATFRYRYQMAGTVLEQPYASQVLMELREGTGEGQKAVYFDMFEGPSRRQFGPMEAREQNPLVIVFLQRDVAQMGRLTGGAAVYFQQQVRRAFNEPAETGAAEIELDGRKVAAKRLVIRPFAHDPNIARFPEFRDKAYEFVVAEEVPGGIYQIAARTPAEGGKMLLEESLTFEEMTP
jgi:hypothetical protein